MDKNYMVFDKDDICLMHWSGAESTWVDFLQTCRDRLKEGELSPTDKIYVDEHEYCEVGRLL